MTWKRSTPHIPKSVRKAAWATFLRSSRHERILELQENVILRQELDWFEKGYTATSQYVMDSKLTPLRNILAGCRIVQRKACRQLLGKS